LSARKPVLGLPRHLHPVVWLDLCARFRALQKNSLQITGDGSLSARGDSSLAARLSHFTEQRRLWAGALVNSMENVHV
jgi:hypothetical protein